MNLISREELKEKIDRGDEFKLVMTLGEFGFRAKHIPGSLSVTSPLTAAEHLNPDDEIVVYCSDRQCVASIYAFESPEQAGYTRVRRYAGGISDWEDAGYPLEGELAE